MRLASIMINSVARSAAAAGVLGILFTFGAVLGHLGGTGHATVQAHAISTGAVLQQPLDDQWSHTAAHPGDDQWSHTAVHPGDDQWSHTAVHPGDDQW